MTSSIPRFGRAAAAAVLLAAACACTPASASPPAPAPPAPTTPASRAAAGTITASGSVRVKVGGEVRVGAQLSGIVERLNVTVGSHINRGDVIAEINTTAATARLAQAKAQVTVAELAVKKAEVDLARARQLEAAQIGTRAASEDAALSVETARAQLDKARRDVAVADVDVSNAVIVAPITGTIASISTQQGETVAASFAAPTFVTIIADQSLEVVAMVDETDIGGVARRQRVTFSVESYPDVEFTGRVIGIAPKATIVSGVVNYETTIAIDQPLRTLRPDMTATIFIHTGDKPEQREAGR